MPRVSQLMSSDKTQTFSLSQPFSRTFNSKSFSSFAALSGMLCQVYPPPTVCLFLFLLSFFRQHTYTLLVCIAGTRIITVRARDDDRDNITYGLEPSLYYDGSAYFSINPRSGDVFLKESLRGKVWKETCTLSTSTCITTLAKVHY